VGDFPQEPQPAKYRNKKVEWGGMTFDSIREFERYQELNLLEAAGEIQHLMCQVAIPLTCGGNSVRSKNGRAISYRVDFQYEEAGETVYEDVKGYNVRESMLKIAVVEAEYGIEIRIVR
jgi:hypothetical protein